MAALFVLEDSSYEVIDIDGGKLVLTSELVDAERLIASGSLDQAYSICRAHLVKQPNAARAYELIGEICFRSGVSSKALEFLAAADRLNNPSAAREALRAQAFESLGNFGEALRAAERAHRIGPTDAATHRSISRVFLSMGRPEAIDHARAAVAMDPDDITHLGQLATTYHLHGDFCEAEQLYRSVIERDACQPMAWLGLALLKPDGLGDQTAALEEIFSREVDADRALMLAHALSKALEDRGDHAEAMTLLAGPKAAKREALNYCFQRDADLFSAARAIRCDKISQVEAAPIFVVGLPRSGTTLIERMLATHPGVVSAGETDEFWVAMKRLTATPSPFALDPATLRAAARIDMTALGRDYLGRVAARTPPAPRFVDKAPLNFFTAGLIHSALPNARIVCLHRDPADVVAANYMQYLTPDFTYYGYTTDLGDTARYVRAFADLMRHWRRTLPEDRFMVMRYETLVRDQEHEARRLLEFCGLSWEPRVLEFHTSPGFVRTASAVQVRQRINSNSIGRSARYGSAFAEARAVLDS